MKTFNEVFKNYLSRIPDQELLSDTLRMLISTKLIKSRVEQNISQNELASMFGISQPALSKWEQGDINFTVEHISKICTALNINYREIFNSLNAREQKTDMKLSPKIIRFLEKGSTNKLDENIINLENLCA